MGFRDSIFNVTINSAAVLKHPWLKFTGNVIVMFPYYCSNFVFGNRVIQGYSKNTYILIYIFLAE